MAVIEADNHYAEVQEIGDDREQRRLLPAMLRGARTERAADFAVQCSRGNQRPGQEAVATASCRDCCRIGHFRLVASTG